MLSSPNRQSYENLERPVLLLRLSMKIEARHGFVGVVVRRIDDSRLSI
ncbi:MAG TPA: hypothetical protein VF345_04920 [Chthoniobacterales bacterium]